MFQRSDETICLLKISLLLLYVHKCFAYVCLCIHRGQERVPDPETRVMDACERRVDCKKVLLTAEPSNPMIYLLK